MVSDKKKILFIHPLGENWTAGEEKDMSRIANIMAPLGLLSLAAWVDMHGHYSKIHDCYAFPGQDEKIYNYIKNERPDYIGFSTTTSSFLDGVRIAEKVKSIKQDIKVIFGGVHISALRDQLLKDYSVIDFGVVGEGEQTLLEIMENNLTDYSGIEGLIHRNNDEVIFNGFRKKLIHMDELPFPAYEKLHGFPESYQLPIFSYPKAPNTTVITSRGCPYECSYCDRSVFRKTYR